MANLCGVNQKLVVEAIEKVRKGKWFVCLPLLYFSENPVNKQEKRKNTRIFVEMEKMLFY